MAIDAEKHHGEVTVRIKLCLDPDLDLWIDAEVTVGGAGLRIRRVGKSGVALIQDWEGIVQGMPMPLSAPARFSRRPAEWLGDPEWRSGWMAQTRENRRAMGLEKATK